MAGASAAYELAALGSVVVLEAESQPGYHATGRSSAFYDETYGAAPVRRMSIASRGFLADPPEGFCERPLMTPRGILKVGREEQVSQLQDFFDAVQPMLGNLEKLSGEEVRRMVPVMGAEITAGVLTQSCLDIDVHAQHLGYLRLMKRRGARIQLGEAVTGIEQRGDDWLVTTGQACYRCRCVINAAGAWADKVAELAGLEALGMSPLKRTVFTFDGPEEMPISGWPLVMDIGESYYFKPDAGVLLATPADETPVSPADVLPEDYDVAVGVARVEQATTLQIEKVRSCWAGLRTFSKDRVMVIGEDWRKQGFYWLAGQGGYGIMSAPANAQLLAALISKSDLPDNLVSAGVSAEAYAPARFRVA